MTPILIQEVDFVNLTEESTVFSTESTCSKPSGTCNLARYTSNLKRHKYYLKFRPSHRFSAFWLRLADVTRFAG